MKFLTDADQAAIAAAVKQAESRTSGEIVFVFTPASGRYQHATLAGALIGMALSTALLLALPIEHTIQRLLWTELLAFAVFYAALPFIPWRRWLISRQALRERVHEAAFIRFYRGGLDKTRDHNGVEIYLSLFEHMVVVIGDAGIHAKMGEPQWDEVRNLVINGINAGQARQGICAAIELCGQMLAQHFPPRPDDRNELPDEVVYRP